MMIKYKDTVRMGISQKEKDVGCGSSIMRWESEAQKYKRGKVEVK